MKETSQKNIQEMQRELDDYLSGKKTPKLFFTSMKEISSWLLTKEK